MFSLFYTSSNFLFHSLFDFSFNPCLLFILNLSIPAYIYTCCLFMVIIFFLFYTEGNSDCTLEDILVFATGANVVPALGFTPQPSIEFLHIESHLPVAAAQKERFPTANTCINCIRLPLYHHFNTFKDNMEFAICNTQGFGQEWMSWMRSLNVKGGKALHLQLNDPMLRLFLTLRSQPLLSSVKLREGGAWDRSIPWVHWCIWILSVLTF